jgi:hypothetical protein
MLNNRFDRRNFLRTTLIGSAGALITTNLLANEKPEDDKFKQKPIIKRKLGKTGIELPIVSFGVMRADSPALIHAALKEGMVHFDTAHSYQRGKNEELLGEIFKDLPRNSFVIGTKIQPEETDRATGKLGAGSTSKAFLEKLDISLKRLNVDYIDILYVHALSTRDAVLFPEMLEAVTQAKKSGKAKFVGVSTHRNEPEVIQAVIDSGIYDVVLTAINYKQEHLSDVTKAIETAVKAGIGVVAMKTMAGAFHDKERTKPINCKAALKFVMQNKNITTSIPGITNFDQLTMNSSVNRDLTLTDEERADLVIEKSQGSLYCIQCGKCVPNCPKRLPIPDIMRAYMYAYGYRDVRYAHQILKDLNLPPNPCGECSSCSAACSQDFSVTERVNDIIRITNIPKEFIA